MNTAPDNVTAALEALEALGLTPTEFYQLALACLDQAGFPVPVQQQVGRLLHRSDDGRRARLERIGAEPRLVDTT